MVFGFHRSLLRAPSFAMCMRITQYEHRGMCFHFQSQSGEGEGKKKKKRKKRRLDPLKKGSANYEAKRAEVQQRKEFPILSRSLGIRNNPSTQVCIQTYKATSKVLNRKTRMLDRHSPSLYRATQKAKGGWRIPSHPNTNHRHRHRLS